MKKSPYSKYKPGTTPKQIRSYVNKGKWGGTEGHKEAGVHVFSGKYERSGNSKYQDGVMGVFTQSIKGMRGKKYIEKAIEMSIASVMAKSE
jgi:hypothetical protein